jgi:hypothetical protein
MSVHFLDALLGKLYARGVEKELRGGLNFGAGLLVTPSAIGYDITPDPAVNIAAMRSTADTTNAVPQELPELAVAVGENQLVYVEARFRGLSRPPLETDNESFTVLTAVFRRVGAGALAQWGSTTTVLAIETSGPWGAPDLIASGNSVVPRVTGEATTSIEWIVDIITRVF